MNAIILKQRAVAIHSFTFMDMLCASCRRYCMFFIFFQRVSCSFTDKVTKNFNGLIIIYELLQPVESILKQQAQAVQDAVPRCIEDWKVCDCLSGNL